MTDSRAQELIRIGNRLFSKLDSYFNLCQEVCANFYPVRADYTSFADPYTNYAQYIQDGYPVIWTEQLASAIPAMLRQGAWFGVGSGDELRDQRPENARALKYATSLMRQQIYNRNSNWDLATNEADHDWVTVGQPVLSIQETRDRRNFYFKAYHPKNCAWLSDELGRPVAMWRRDTLTARNILVAHNTGRFNGEVSEMVKLAARMEPDKEFKIYHVLIPVSDLYAADAMRQRRIGNPYASVYVCCEDTTYLHEGSMPLFNYVCPAYRRLGNMTRGFSPACWNALGDARMLQAMALTILEQGEKAVDPPIVGAGEVFNRDINLMAGGWTFADLGDRNIRDVVMPLETGNNVRLGVDLKQDIRSAIAESLMINKLTMPSIREMTATETIQRVEEFRRAALPFFTPIEGEYHSQLLGLLFDMMQARGVFPDGLFPRELQEVEEVKFTFTTPLNEADGRKQVEAFFAGIQMIAAASEVDQTVKNLWKVRDTTVRALEGAGIDPEDIKTEREREEADQQAAVESEFSRAAQLAQGGAGVVADMANARLANAQAEAVGA